MTALQNSTGLTAEQIVAFLNEVLARDPVWLQSLMSTRHPCNAVIANHPHIQVLQQEAGKYEASVLGLLNGLIAQTSTTPEDTPRIYAFIVGTRIKNFELSYPTHVTRRTN
jgi:hypothetical protein